MVTTSLKIPDELVSRLDSIAVALVAYLDKSARDHEWAKDQCRRLTDPLLTRG